MKVFLFRHGQKDSVPFRDPDLTPFGRQQARRMAEMIQSGELERGTQFMASPRLRAQSTLAPAAELCRQPIQIASDLDQREGFETGEIFRARIQQFLLTLEKNFSPHDVIYLCSHHDWIEEALSAIPADTDLLEARYWSWAPTQYMHFDVHEGLWHLQRFDKLL